MTRCPPRAKVTEHGVRFETGHPAVVRFIRNTTAAPRPGPHDVFQQRLEPAGRFMLHSDRKGPLPPGWERGTVRFKSPLVVPMNDDPESDRIYDERSWKANLSREYGGKRGRALSRAIGREHDAVVTVPLDKSCRGTETREVVDLRMFYTPKKIVTAKDILRPRRSR